MGFVVQTDMRCAWRTLAGGLAAGLSCATLWLGAPGCAPPDPVPAPRDLLLVTLDTARADRFAYTGSSTSLTPRIDALAGQGVGFGNAISPVPLTLPAHASLLTGRQPPSHTVRDNGAYRLPSSETTLAEVLQRAGFVTGAFVGAEVLDARYGLNQGFDTYDAEIAPSEASPFLYYAERSAEEVVAATSGWLDAQDERPVFAWVHLFDPHTPYRPPEPERSSHDSAYDGEIAYVDRIVGRLVDHWAERRGLERTLIVITSDHGEALGEHDESTHGVLVHDATLRVPLVIRSPGLRLEETVAAPVHLVDVMPTVLALLDLQPPASIQGRNLVPLLQGKQVEWSPASGYAESLYAQLHHGAAPLFALREDRWKLVRGLGEELYDLELDPAELKDRAAAEPTRRNDLARALDALTAELAGGDAETLTMDDETRRALESLGYAWSRSPTSTASRDPREILGSMKRMAEADRRAVAGDVEGAVAVYRTIIDAEPASVDARVRLAQILIAGQRHAEAAELLASAVAVAPHEPFLPRKLGNVLELLGRPADALEVYDAGLARHPDERELREGRWRCLNKLQRREELLADAERAIARDPADGGARYARAIACCGQPLAAYIAALERELRELPGDPLLEAAMAQARAEAAKTRAPDPSPPTRR